MKQNLFCLSVIISFFLISVNSALGARGDISYQGDENDFSLSFIGKEFVGIVNESLEDSPRTPTTYNPQEALTTGVKYFFVFNADNDTKDFGFRPSYNTQFGIAGYTGGKMKYIKSIEIEWALKDNHDGALHVYARGEGKSPYELSTAHYDYITTDNSIDKVLSPYTSINGKSVWEFDTPIRYIAFNREDDANNNNLARFKSFTIHFVDEWKGSDSQKTELMLGSGEGDVKNIIWRNTGMSLSNPLRYADDILSIPNLSDLGIKFYLTPDFEIVEKPKSQNDISHEMKADAWNLFNLFETHNKSYDGYLESAEAILCRYDNYDNINIPAPCSGRYVLSAVSDDANVQIKNTLTLNIWTDIDNDYSSLIDLAGDNIDSKLLEFSLNLMHRDSSGIIQYPYEDMDPAKGPWSKDKVTIFVPGLYNAEFYYKWQSLDGNKQGVSSKMSATDSDTSLTGFTKVTSEQPLSVAHLSESNSTDTLELRILKNNSVTPLAGNGKSEIVVPVQLSKTTNVNTNIGIISKDETLSNAPVEYFNIQGQKVSEANLIPGIYIVKQGSKTTKIKL